MTKPAYPADLPTLTGLRGLAAAWLLLFHARGTLPFDVDAWTPVLARGPLGVDGFFILSGFVLAHVSHRDIAAGRFAVGPFLHRRLARIYPLHLATLGLYLAALAAAALLGRAPNDPGRYDLAALPANLLLIHAWGVTNQLTFNYPSWSVSAEWFAYLLFPVLAPALLRTRHPIRALALVAAGFLVLAWLVPLLHGGKALTRLTYDLSVLRILPTFLLGIALYRTGQIAALPAALTRPGLPLTAFALIVLLHVQAPDAVIVLMLGAVVLLAAERARARAAGGLAAPAAVRLGTWSFALYLVHVPVLGAWSAIVPAQGAIAWTAGLILCLVAAWLAHEGIERPGRALVLGLRWQPRAGMRAREDASR
ncbi:acyltransferase family protein [Marinivivus vitaminiproducens]|uniref:acyltransferase family protein n=1 Tax=Marinivivus vitaminiproducens TaxID=3035935 RepID=UPI0027986889|nr:acyltransferase [Geminicoccaceae bacterium SCSIO 64248]